MSTSQRFKQHLRSQGYTPEKNPERFTYVNKQEAINRDWNARQQERLEQQLLLLEKRQAEAMNMSVCAAPVDVFPVAVSRYMSPGRYC